jgi:molecular chaperone DnaJ
VSDFYKLLGVAKDASEADIKKAYRRLAMELHPDRNSAADAEERFKEATEAYEVLRDPEKRAAYDRYGDAAFSRNARQGGFGGGFHHVDLAEALQIFMRDFGGGGGFDSIFGGGQRARGEARRGQDLRVEVTLTTAEVATGTKRTLKLRTLGTCETCKGSGAKAGTSPVTCSTCRGQGEVQRAAQSMFGQFISVAPCPTCRGEGSVIKEPCEECKGEGRTKQEKTVAVEVPPGVSSANYLTLRGQGATGPRGGPAGDLLVMLEVKDDERWTRQGDDLVYDLALSFSQAALGGNFPIPSPYGEEKVKIPAGTQAGTVFRVKGKGLPKLGTEAKGNLLVRTALWTPEELTAEQKKLFTELAKIEGEPPKKTAHGLWDRLRDALGA